MTKKTTTAEELLAQLRRDPEWVAQQQETARRQAASRTEFAVHERPILEALSDVGFEIPSLEAIELIEDKLPLPKPAVDVLLR